MAEKQISCECLLTSHFKLHTPRYLDKKFLDKAGLILQPILVFYKFSIFHFLLEIGKTDVKIRSGIFCCVRRLDQNDFSLTFDHFFQNVRFSKKLKNGLSIKSKGRACGALALNAAVAAGFVGWLIVVQ